jgi:transcriptional regulator with XRE-family HTH domain
MRTKQLARYLRKVRETMGLSAKDVADETKRRYPRDKRRQISFSYLCLIERGRVKEIFPMKLKSLAEIYGENYTYLLYLAGYLNDNPKEPKNEIQRIVYYELAEDKLLKKAVGSKEGLKLNAGIRNAIRKAVRIAARAAFQTITNEN